MNIAFLQGIVWMLPINHPDLKMSTRCMNALINAYGTVPKGGTWRHIEPPTLYRVMGTIDAQLLLVRNFGRKSLEEVQRLRVETGFIDVVGGK